MDTSQLAVNEWTFEKMNLENPDRRYYLFKEHQFYEKLNKDGSPDKTSKQTFRNYEKNWRNSIAAEKMTPEGKDLVKKYQEAISAFTHAVESVEKFVDWYMFVCYSRREKSTDNFVATMAISISYGKKPNAIFQGDSGCKTLQSFLIGEEKKNFKEEICKNAIKEYDDYQYNIGICRLKASIENKLLLPKGFSIEFFIKSSRCIEEALIGNPKFVIVNPYPGMAKKFREAGLLKMDEYNTTDIIKNSNSSLTYLLKMMFINPALENSTYLAHDKTFMFDIPIAVKYGGKRKQTRKKSIKKQRKKRKLFRKVMKKKKKTRNKRRKNKLINM
jgi:hypothetical protein